MRDVVTRIQEITNALPDGITQGEQLKLLTGIDMDDSLTRGQLDAVWDALQKLDVTPFACALSMMLLGAELAVQFQREAIDAKVG